MKFKLFGNTGLRVSEISLGTMTFGEEVDWGASKDESRKIFNAYLDKGGNFIDTANYYTRGTSEKFIGEFMKGMREKLVIATKYTSSMDFADPNASGSHRKNMVQAVEASLKRLGTDYIDLYWVHAFDRFTPVDELMRGLDDLVRSGKVLYIGFSDAPAWIVSQANTMAELRGWTQFAGIQIEYSLIERTPEYELIPMADKFDLAVAAWSPLASGILTGKYSKDRESKEDRLDKAQFKELTERNMKIADACLEVSGETGRSPAQVALRWIMRKGGNMIPIIGARKLSHLEDNLGAADFVLSDDLMQKLDEASHVEPWFPHNFLNSPHIERIIHDDSEYDV
ncbi:MAG: aldo/keto reductase [Bacteroidota bacterium]